MTNVRGGIYSSAVDGPNLRRTQRGQIYSFASNGQGGKLYSYDPIGPKEVASWTVKPS